MPDLLVNDVPEEIVAALKLQAAEHGRSVEDEHRAILEQILRPDCSAFRERACQLREDTKGRTLTDSANIIRQHHQER